MTPEVKQRIEQIRRGEVPEGYKKTALGIVPANWIETTLGKIYTERNEPGNDSLPLLMVSIHSGVSDGEVAEEDLPKKAKRIEDKSQYKHAMPGDLVFNMMRAWQGAIGSARTEGMVSPAYIVAKPNDMVDPIFMDYYMKMPHMISMIHRQSYGVTDFRLRLYWDSFSPIPCVLPPIEEQKRIAEILSAQDTLINLQRKEVSAYQQLKRAYLSKLLPKGKNKEPELRFKGFTAAWEQRKLSEITTLITKGTTPLDKSGEGEINFIKVENLDSDSGEIISHSKITAAEHDGYLKRSQLKENDILFSIAGTLGRVGIVKSGILPANTNQALAIIRLKEGNLRYISTVLRGRTVEDYMRRNPTVGAQPNLSLEQVGNLEIPYPMLSEQIALGDFFSGIDTLITLHQREVEFHQSKEKAYTQLLLTGKVRVTL